jgi:hypothetical protein
VLVLVDDYSRFTWVAFLKHKSDTFQTFVKFCNKVQLEKDAKIKRIRSDHGGEFENSDFEKFCDDTGIKHEFEFPPSQNGIVERKNRTLQEMARTMLNEFAVPKFLWAEAVSTACYIINRVHLRPKMKKTPYELWNGRLPRVEHLKIFGSNCYVLDTSESKDKFASKTLDGLFVGYSNHSKAYRVYLKNERTVIETLHAKFDEYQEEKGVIEQSDDEVCIEDKPKKGKEPSEQLPPTDRDWRFKKNHPRDQIIGDISRGVQTRRSVINLCCCYSFVSMIEPKNIEEACNDEYWIAAMQDELNQFTKNSVWSLVPKPEGKSIIGTKLNGYSEIKLMKMARLSGIRQD